ncbi:MAG: hypothetical protein IJI24_06925, partial [Lachnospiraceae bacterium]|nr:hypothetical protein [Lachnospiraceae bacterium]
ITDPIPINVRELGESGVSLRAIVLTRTVEENFAACSQIRRDLVKAFSLDPTIEFAYPHVQLTQHQTERETLLKKAHEPIL